MAIPKIKPTGEISTPEKISAANIVVPGSFEKKPESVLKSDEPGVQVQQATDASSEEVKSNLPVVEVIGNSNAAKVYKQLSFVVHEGYVYVVFEHGGSKTAVPITDNKVRRCVSELIEKLEIKVKRGEIRGFLAEIQAIAEEHAPKWPVYHRYAPLSSGGLGVEIALYNPSGDRIEVNAEGWREVELPSRTVFKDSVFVHPLPYPAAIADVSALRRAVNLDDMQFKLLIGWLTYTMSLPKVQGSKYVFLVINADQGSGKSFLSYIISRLVDPNSLGIKALPRSEKELGLILAHTHVACFDNTRTLSNKQSDRLCQISSGATDISRQLYTDASLHVTRLHGAVVLNGIHDLITQSDLAQRCMTLHLKKIPNSKIRSEAELLQMFEKAHPAIFAYLLDIMAGAFKALPDVKVLRRERQIDFCKWLAACEVAMELEMGELQNAYSDNLKEAQLDTLLGNPLAAAILDFVNSWKTDDYWKGTPKALLLALTEATDVNGYCGRDLPDSPISLSKKLRGLKASLLTQGIEIEFKRGKERLICITNHNVY